jgi:hypothetical protein
MEGEFFERQDVIRLPARPQRRADVANWDLSLRRLARAQAVLWHETPINERLRVLALVDQDMKEEQ